MIEAFRRDPSAIFVALGSAYLALGRPRDTVEVGARGLQSDPNNLDGRVMVAQAFAQLHQWKEAQAELLKVVKADRKNAPGFRLLGEVLMRRSDYERALPVLQHAQDLSPADPAVLALLKRARAGQPLEPPPPVPSPVAPTSSGHRGPPRAPRPSPYPEEMPTRVAGGTPERSADDDGVLARMDLERREVQREGLRAPVDRGTRRADDRGRDRDERRPVEVHAPPPLEDPLSPLGAPVPERRPKAPTASPTMAPGVRPRVLPLEKPKDAAQASLRQSVAVGEDYLNNLLVGGLLEVPRVRVADVSYDVVPDKRWGRSTLRMFIYLFVLLFLGAGGAGGWYWYAEKQRAEDVARLVATATKEIELGDYQALLAADTAARAAIERDRTNNYAIAVLGEITGLETYLYRELDAGQAEKAVALASEDVVAPTDQGFRELLVAKAAVALASLSPAEEGSERRLADISKELAAWLGAHPDDALIHWLEGEALLAAGLRQEASVAFERAHAGGKGTVLGTIALADLRVDEGKYDEARALYDDALARAPKHPWAFLGRSVVRSERSIELEDAMGDLNVGVAQAAGPRVAAYKRLALATAHLGLEDYAAFKTELDQAIGVDEPRFLVRVGLLRLAQGNISDAAAARAKIRWYADKPQPDPLVSLLDAELLLARGLPGAALELIGKQDGLRAARLRGRALFDLGQPAEAAKELGDALEVAPDDLETRTWAEAARYIASTGEDRRKADDALDSLGRKAKTKVARLAHGLAYAAAGKAGDARARLAQSVADISDEYPNALAYRSHVALGELDLAEAKLADAASQAQQALDQNPGYLPAHDLIGRALIEAAPDKALTHLSEVVSAEVASVGGELGYARLVAGADAAAATAALDRAKQKGATVAQLQALHPFLPAELFARLGVPAPRPSR